MPQLRYRVLARGGSELIHNRVLLPALETERELLLEGRVAVDFTDRNYRLEPTSGL